MVSLLIPFVNSPDCRILTSTLIPVPF